MIYAPKLAYRMHLAYSEDGNYYKDLNHNSGVLFAKATEKEDGTLQAKSLKKPYLFHITSRSIPGEYGPGHNAYVIDDNGIYWSTYHARPGVEGPRSSGLRRVHFDIDGYPVLDLPEYKDLNKSLSKVEMDVIIK